MEWTDVMSNPILKDLPFKIELNQFGKILMSPASNHHGRTQMHIGYRLMNALTTGEVIAECSIQTDKGVKVADVVWASADFIAQFAYETPYPKAPEICIEIISPSNSKAEMTEKIALYLAKGALEVWMVDKNGKIQTFNKTGEIEKSRLATNVQD